MASDEVGICADPVVALRDAMRAAGIATDASIEADGCLHRFHVEGDKHGRRDGWYVLHATPYPAGAFGHWRTGYTQTWRLQSDSELTPAERARVDEAVAEAKAERERAQQKRHLDAQARAQVMWHQAGSALSGHHYLLAREVRPHGIRQRDELLLIPMRDTAGELWAVQTIAPDGTKRFLSGSRKRGLYFGIGAAVVDVLLLAEGYATAATLHEATGHPVAVAFDCGNLEPVAVALRAKYPSARIVICADNDADTAARTGSNPGIEAATRAARAVGGSVVCPIFPKALTGMTDFADLRQWCGDQPIRDAVVVRS